MLVRIASMSGSDEPQQSMFGQEIRSGLLVPNRVQKRELYKGKYVFLFFFFFFLLQTYCGVFVRIA